MKALKSNKFLSLILGLIYVAAVNAPSIAQEYDDMYFNESDRKIVKVKKDAASATLTKNNSADDYKKISESTETFSAKNINPEYIARYKSPESNEVSEQLPNNNNSYSSEDYFVEGYDESTYVGDTNKNDIDYAALALRDQMSYSNYNRSYSNPSWRFNPYMSMNMGYGGFGYPGFYDPFMMGYGPGLTMGMGMGFGYPSAMSYNIGMSWGTGYNPYGSWGRYPGFYDPWGSMYSYNPYYGGGYGYSPYYRTYPGMMVVTSGNYNDNIRRIQYKPRTTRSSTTSVRSYGTNSDNTRVASSDRRLRVPNQTTTTSTSNGRVGTDYSRSLNENSYTRARRTSASSSTQRMSSNNSTRSTYTRNRGYSGSTSSINTTSKPSRTSSYSSGNSSSYSNRSSYTSGSRSSSSFSTPSRSSYSSGNSRSSSSFSTGSSNSRSSSGGTSSGGSRSSSGTRRR